MFATKRFRMPRPPWRWRLPRRDRRRGNHDRLGEREAGARGEAASPAWRTTTTPS